MKRTIRDFVLEGKKVIIRVDFNVPIKNGVIQDDTRIKEAIPTISYAVNNGAKVILMSHLGRIKCRADMKHNVLEPVALRLSELLDKEIIYVVMTRGKVLEREVNSLNNGDILLVENTRFEDLDNKESSNDVELGKYWASLGDIFINDAFGTSHRSHASNVGIASSLPSGIGFLVEKELNVFQSSISNPKRPFTVILGGAKVSDKIRVIENLVNVADHILIGGGMAFTFLKAMNVDIGLSLFDKDSIDFCRKMLDEYSDKIVLPVDVVTSLSASCADGVKTVDIGFIEPNAFGVDIGIKTVKSFEKYLKSSKTVVWNGPVGKFEVDAFASGTKAICEILSGRDTTIIGGGDTASAVKNLGFEDFTHISTGGGAFLVLLEGKSLPGIDIIDDYE